MANEILITKITMSDMTKGIVNWIYGDDSVSMASSTCLDMSTLSMSERQSNSAVKTLLESQLSDAQMAEFDKDLNEQETP
jgi:hypothetical protein|tara:strand:+ start:990 stop:1229 length:240 start_codon:yes stop_codon:yes gene_type:complete